MAGAVRLAHGWWEKCGEAGHSGGVCGTWCKAKAVGVGKRCRRRGSVGVSEELHMSCVIVIAVRRTGQ